VKTGDKKPEYMTSLSGTALVPKTHGRIAFRGLIDTLQTELIEAQVLASQLGEEGICSSLGEILTFLRALMAAEVKETPIPPPFLFGMEAEEIHRLILEAEWGSFPVPAYSQGPLAARINKLRAKVREVELLAVRVFGPQEEAGQSQEREDIVLAMNRLSNALWWLFCKFVSGKQ
jgi:ethanolamine utilization cobalamin adenosyltransferase